MTLIRQSLGEVSTFLFGNYVLWPRSQNYTFLILFSFNFIGLNNVRQISSIIIQIIKTLFDIMCFDEILMPEKHCNWDVI